MCSRSATVLFLPLVLVIQLTSCGISQAAHGASREEDSSVELHGEAVGNNEHDVFGATAWHSGAMRHRRAKDDNVCELEINCGGRNDDGQRTGSSSGVVRLPIRGQRGPPGPPGPPGERGPKGQDGAGDLTGIAGARRKVAFFVGLSENMGPITENTDVKFDRIITNVGDAYDSASGKFTAPVDGVYQFNVIISAQGRQKAAVMVLKNGEMVTTVWSESVPSWATSSNVAILSLAKGDHVWLSLLSRASYLHGYMYSTFSGFIIFDN